MDDDIGFCEALTLIFVAAKIFGFIDWSWWAVFAPIWIPLLLLAWLGILASNWIIGAVIGILFALEVAS